MPTVKGGQKSLQQAVQEKVQYPKRARLAGIEGTVYVQFTVAEDGTVRDVEIVGAQGFGLGPAVVNAVEQLTFNPGRQGHVPVPVLVRLPVKFTLR